MKYKIEIEFEFPEELSQAVLDDLSDESLNCLSTLPTEKKGEHEYYQYAVLKQSCKMIDAKASLTSKLNELGIEVVAGKVKKSDIQKVLADDTAKVVKSHWIDEVKKIVSESQAGKVDGKMVDGFTASAVDSVYENLSPETREKFKALPFSKAVDVAWKMINKK